MQPVPHALGPTFMLDVSDMRALIVLSAILIAAPAAAQVSVTDGDTIKLGGMTYRLWGIDAPESMQVCADGWHAGAAATRKLESLVKERAVVCEVRDRDRYGRTVGLCRTGDGDLGAAMVRAGMAWAFTRYSSDYVADEKVALVVRAGVHAHPCEKAWEWRAINRR